MNTKERDKNNSDKETFWLPENQIEAFACCFLPSIRKYFDTPEGQEAFAA